MKKRWLYGNIPEGSQIHISPPKRTPGSQNGSQKFNHKIANPQNEPWARLGFPAAQKIEPACKSERKNYKGPKEAMTPKVLKFAPHAEMVILNYHN